MAQLLPFRALKSRERRKTPNNTLKQTHRCLRIEGQTKGLGSPGEDGFHLKEPKKV